MKMSSDDDLDITLKEVNNPYVKRKRSRRIEKHEGAGTSC